MYTVLLVAHTIVILFLIGIILLQRPEGDGLSGLGGGGGNILSGRAAGNVLTRTTAILAALFFISSLALAFINGHTTQVSLIDKIADSPAVQAVKPIKPAPEKAAVPATPDVPKPE